MQEIKEKEHGNNLKKKKCAQKKHPEIRHGEQRKTLPKQKRKGDFY